MAPNVAPPPAGCATCVPVAMAASQDQTRRHHLLGFSGREEGERGGGREGRREREEEGERGGGREGRREREEEGERGGGREGRREREYNTV